MIFYDQLGCGNSERPDDPSLWTANRYFDEVKAVRDYLGLKRYHLLGHSWGTTLAMGFAHRYPEGIITMSLHSPILSFTRYTEKMAPPLKENLPAGLAEIIDACELNGVGCDERYENAVLEFVRRYVILTWPLPEPIQRLISCRGHQVHDVMVGSESELNVPGNLKDVDVSAYLKNFTMPILFTCGRFDFCTPNDTAWHHSLATNAEMYVIEDSAHMTLMDNPAELLSIQLEFMHRSENIAGDSETADGSRIPEKGVTIVSIVNGSFTFAGTVIPKEIPSPWIRSLIAAQKIGGFLPDRAKWGVQKSKLK